MKDERLERKKKACNKLEWMGWTVICLYLIIGSMTCLVKGGVNLDNALIIYHCVVLGIACMCMQQLGKIDC